MREDNIPLTEQELAEIAKRKQEMLDYYKDQIEFLAVQDQFEKLATSIQESRTKRLMYKLQEIQLSMSGKENEEQGEDGSEAKPTPTRNLKREK